MKRFLITLILIIFSSILISGCKLRDQQISNDVSDAITSHFETADTLKSDNGLVEVATNAYLRMFKFTDIVNFCYVVVSRGSGSVDMVCNP